VLERKGSNEQQQQQQQLTSMAVSAAEIEQDEALRWKDEVIDMFLHGAPVSTAACLPITDCIKSLLTGECCWFPKESLYRRLSSAAI
jgi:hypothetical protein